MESSSLDNSLPHLEDVENMINIWCNEKPTSDVSEDRLIEMKQWYDNEALTMAHEQSYNISIKKDDNATPKTVQVFEGSSVNSSDAIQGDQFAYGSATLTLVPLPPICYDNFSYVSTRVPGQSFTPSPESQLAVIAGCTHNQPQSFIQTQPSSDLQVLHQLQPVQLVFLKPAPSQDMNELPNVAIVDQTPPCMYVPSQGTPVNQMMITSDAESLGTQQVQDFPTIAAPSTTSICSETISPSSAAEPAPGMTCAEYFSSVQLTFDDLDTSDPSSAYSMPSFSYAQVLQAATHLTLAAQTVQAIDPSASHAQVPALKTLIQEKKPHSTEILCKICNRKFSGPANLSQHVLHRHHQGTRPFRCTICGKSYLTEQDMLDHRRNHDPSMKPYKCQSCEKRYRHGFDLDRHSEKHHGTMPYVCIIEGCPMAFSRRDHLKRHLDSHEGQSTKRQREREEERVMSQNEKKRNRKGREE
ncbi:zinc finger and BTB domain-containing protein 42 [Aedes albopictus]|uniref:C2H2-type domain-containing protein n=1 Tax=Aedes albopictus TaxID=7160 RepID=A0ABM1YIE9_AEDAL|nr:zinc finger and BTB domain-containing protein 42 [Aedes albopictus]XP_029736087.1 zinc finger and BTB domain-containing protein 42 [Aedes albopictus]